MGEAPKLRSAARGAPAASATEMELARVRSLLLGKDYERLLALQEDYEQLLALKNELSDPTKQTSRIAGVLSEAVLLREHQDSGVSKALRPAIADTLKASVQKDPQSLVDAIFPIIGPAIRRSVNEAITGMLELFNQLLEHNLSLRALKWRFESWRTGRSYAEVVLLRTLIYRVDQVFLIHRETGLLLQHVALQHASIKDPDLIGSMLTAIKDFMSDSFTVPRDASVQSLKVGDYNVVLEEGRLAVLAAVVRGNAPNELSRAMQETLQTIHLLYNRELRQFEGDSAPFEGTRSYLEDCLKSQARSEGKRRPWLTLILLAAAVLMPLGYWGYKTYHQYGVWSAALQQLRSEPGLVVIATEKEGDLYKVMGLRDPLARDPAAVIGSEAQASLQWDWKWQPYLSMQHEFLLTRAKQALQPPDTVAMSLDGTVLVISGEASQRWIDNARVVALRIPGISGYQDADLKLDNRQQMLLQRYRQKIEATEFYFDFREATLGEAQNQRLKTLVSTIEALQSTAGELGLTVRIRAVGHADQTGLQTQNLQISQLRADNVVEALTAQGVDSQLFIAVGVGSRTPARTNATPEEQIFNRRVTLEVLFEGGDPATDLDKGAGT